MEIFSKVFPLITKVFPLITKVFPSVTKVFPLVTKVIPSVTKVFPSVTMVSSILLTPRLWNDNQTDSLEIMTNRIDNQQTYSK